MPRQSFSTCLRASMLRAKTDPRGRSGNRDRLHSGYGTQARGGENSTPGSRDALPHRGPARRQPFLSGAEEGIPPEARKALSWRIAVKVFSWWSRRILPGLTCPGSIAAITLGANAAHHHAYHPLTILAAFIGLALIAISNLLWVCRPVGANPGSNGDNGDHAIVVPFSRSAWVC